MEEILSAYFITEKNIEELKRDLGASILPHIPGTAIEFEVGKTVVIQTIKTPDLFDSSFSNVLNNAWLVPRKKFDEMFVVTEAVETENFAIIARK